MPTGNSISYVRENTKHAFYSQVGLMIVLFGMHVYWTIFMLKVGSGIFSAGKYKNVYDNRENKLDHKKKENWLYSYIEIKICTFVWFINESEMPPFINIIWKILHYL